MFIVLQPSSVTHFLFFLKKRPWWKSTQRSTVVIITRMPDDWRALDHKVNHSTFSRRRGESTHPALQDSVSRTQSSPSLAHTHRLPSLPDISDSEGLWTEGMSPLDTWCSASSDGESEHQHVSARRILISLLFMNLAAQAWPIAVWVAIAL